jgi:hypothetical protein
MLRERINIKMINVHLKVSRLAVLVCGQGRLLRLAKRAGGEGKAGEGRSTVDQ